MVDAALFSSATGEWETPEKTYRPLDEEFGFTFDPCSSHENRKTVRYSTLEGTFTAPLGEDGVVTRLSEQDGLVCSWAGEVVFMNPPYGEPEFACKKNCKKEICKKRGAHNPVYRPGIIDWVRKAFEESKAGATVVGLLPARTDTKWWHRYIWDSEKDWFREEVEQIRFIPGRLKFGGADNSAPFPSVVVVWRSK